MGHLKSEMKKVRKNATITPISEPWCQHRNLISSAPNSSEAVSHRQASGVAARLFGQRKSIYHCAIPDFE
jgi:hypothetical protein